MVFASVPFLFVFLPAVLAAYFLCPRRWHNAVLLVFSLFFYAWGEPVYILLMLSSITVSFLAGRALGRAHTPARRRAVLSASVAYHLLTLGFFKYADFLIGTVNSLFGLSLPLLSLPLPIGISFYTFQTLSYIVDVYRGVCAPQRRWDWLAMYVSLFPQLIAGPIVRYQTVEQQIAHRTVSRAQCAEGVRRFTVGLVKKVLLANSIGLVFTQILGNGALPQSVLAAWVAVAAYTFQIYFDFAGYSDMAIGLGKLFGFTFEENFNLPYLSRSITEFWRRWHISLGTWFRDYVYIPLGGNRCGWGRQLFNIAVVWLLTGLWHGASWNFVLWGAYYAVLLMVEKLGLLRVLARLPRMLQHAYALFFIVVGWALFACTEPGQLSGVFGALFGLSGVPLYDASSLFLLKNNVLLWLLLVFASTASFARLHTHLLSRRWYAEVLCPLGLAAALLACTAFIVSGSFNPFLYFRF
ncbi:MAG: MBOAT family protein [Clostridiales bacterium]|jgi:alginate O-acetylation protein algI|nr:MBOAT family protein [Clostridiales bacterium]